ncbi:Siroheme synthase [Streptococcus pneumoniae]|nr:Siroheme synthase [Streptococcus pneumoniae]
MGTATSQHTVTGTLQDITNKAKEITNPAMIIVGDVVNMREKISWFEEQAFKENVNLAK